MDILIFTLFCAFCLIVCWCIFRYITNKAIKQMRNLAQETFNEMHFEASELIQEIQGKNKRLLERRDMTIFDDVARVMNQDTVRRLSRKTGLTKDKVYRLSSGLPFVLDYNMVFALQRLGYEIRLEKLSHETDN